MLACTETTLVQPFAGHWVGGNSDFQAVLTLLEGADTVHGSFQLTRRGGGDIASSLAVHPTVQGHSIIFSFVPDTTSGYAGGVFEGQRRGDQMDAELTLDSLMSTLTLNRN